jgi:HEAT repeat protein
MRNLMALNLLICGLLLSPMSGAQDSDAVTDRSLYQAVDVAREMMSSDDIYDRILAAGALSDIGDAQALVLLERCIAIDDIVIRRSAIDTLISGSHPNSVNLLFKAASKDDEVLGLMAESLASVPRDDMGDLLLDALDDQSDFVKKHALQALVRSTGSAENAAVRKLVAASSTSPVIRAYGNYALVSGGESSVGAAMLATAGASSNADELEVAAVASDSSTARNPEPRWKN